MRCARRRSRRSLAPLSLDGLENQRRAESWHGADGSGDPGVPVAVEAAVCDCARALLIACIGPEVLREYRQGAACKWELCQAMGIWQVPVEPDGRHEVELPHGQHVDIQHVRRIFRPSSVGNAAVLIILIGCF